MVLTYGGEFKVQNLRTSIKETGFLRKSFVAAHRFGKKPGFSLLVKLNPKLISLLWPAFAEALAANKEDAYQQFLIFLQ